MAHARDNQHISGRKHRTGLATGLAAAAALGFLVPAANAQTVSAVPAPSSGFYIGGGLGANFEDANRFRGGHANATVNYSPDFAGIMNFGYGFGNGLRLELEPGYWENPVSTINGGQGGGRTQMATLMANVLYDIPFVTPIIPLQPHIGVGAGYAHVWDRSGPQNGLGVSGQANVPAFQAIGGLDYALSPSTKIGVDYHFVVAHDANFQTSNGLTTRAGDLDNHMVMLTLRYQFNTPSAPLPTPVAFVPPPPRPAPAPVAALPERRPFEVYFGFDRSNLTPDGRAVVDQAAANVKQGNATQILATGHTDTVGTGSYNLALSVRRADTVRGALIADGVPANEIRTSGVGEAGLAVETAADVNEPRNRRVEIVIEAPGM